MKSLKLTIYLFILFLFDSCQQNNEPNIQLVPIRVETIDPMKDPIFESMLDDFIQENQAGRVANSFLDSVDYSAAERAINEIEGVTRYSLLVRGDQGLQFTNIIFKKSESDEYYYYFIKYYPDLKWLVNSNFEFDTNSFTGYLSFFKQNGEHLLDMDVRNGNGQMIVPVDEANGRVECNNGVNLDGTWTGSGAPPNGGSSGSVDGHTHSKNCIVTQGSTGNLIIECSGGLEFKFRTACGNWESDEWEGGGDTSGDGNGPIGIVIPEATRKAYALKMVLNLDNAESEYLENRPNFSDEILNFLANTESETGSKNLASKAVTAKMNGGTVDFEERLVYNPTLDQDYRNQMAEQEKQLFDGLNSLQQSQYLISAQQAWNYADSYYGDTFYNGLGDAVRHSFWNALSTVRLGENLTKQLTDAHETKPGTYEFSYKEDEMDLHNNAEGRLIAFMAGKLYQLIENALSTGELRYLTDLTGPLAPKQGRATSTSQLIPTNE